MDRTKEDGVHRSSGDSMDARMGSSMFLRTRRPRSSNFQSVSASLGLLELMEDPNSNDRQEVIQVPFAPSSQLPSTFSGSSLAPSSRLGSADWLLAQASLSFEQSKGQANGNIKLDVSPLTSNSTSSSPYQGRQDDQPLNPYATQMEDQPVTGLPHPSDQPWLSVNEGNTGIVPGSSQSFLSVYPRAESAPASPRSTMHHVHCGEEGQMAITQLRRKHKLASLLRVESLVYVPPFASTRCSPIAPNVLEPQLSMDSPSKSTSEVPLHPTIPPTPPTKPFNMHRFLTPHSTPAPYRPVRSIHPTQPKGPNGHVHVHVHAYDSCSPSPATWVPWLNCPW